MDDTARQDLADWPGERLPALVQRAAELRDRLTRLRAGTAVSTEDVDRARSAAHSATRWSRRAWQQSQLR